MKHAALHRLLCILCLCVTLLFAALPALANTSDLSAMSDEEVVALLKEVNQEIVNRHIQKTAKLAKGTYIAGQELPVGSYTFTCLATGDDWGSVTIYADGGEGKQLLWKVVSAPENGQERETIYITLKEGDELTSGVPFSLTTAGGVVFE